MPTVIDNGQTDGSTRVPLCHIVTPVGMLGYGFNDEQTSVALASLTATSIRTALILDSGSTDSGPAKLALGSMTCPRSSYARDLAKLLKLVDKFRVPLIFSSAGGDGSDEHVREMVDIIEEIASREENIHYRFKTMAIFSGVEKTLVLDRLRAGAITGCGKFVRPLTEADIESSARIVGQMGPEPFLDAMEANPDFDIIVGGRAYDPAPYIAYVAHLQRRARKSDISVPESGEEAQWGAFAHMGKIMECGGLCAEPKSAGAVGTMYSDATFDMAPLDPDACCSTLSVAAHTLYEKSRPDLLHGPGGYLDVTASTYEQLPDGRTVRVRGSRFFFSRKMGLPYQLKLEAATVVGYRSMYMGSIRDPILASQMDLFTSVVKDYVAAQHRDVPGSWELGFHIYGGNQKKQLMGNWNDGGVAMDSSESSGVFIIGEALASSQELATSVASTARIATVHGSYPDQKATSGNFAMGIGGRLEIELGPCCQFSVYHLMDLEKGEERLGPPHGDMAVTSRSGQNSITDVFQENGNHCHRSLHSYSVSTVGRGEGSAAVSMVTTASTASTPAQGAAVKGKTQANRVSNEGNQPHEASQAVAPAPKTIGDVARILRSKNAGPYEITFDIMFASRVTYALVKQAKVLTTASIARLFNLSEEDVIWCGFFDPALAFKATIPRLRGGRCVAAGGFMEDDVHGSQQYLGLLHLRLPDELAASLAKARNHG